MRRILIYLALALGAGQARADSSTVLVFPFENASSDRTLDWIGEGISELIVERLQPEAGVYTFSREERLAAFEKLGIPETTLVSRATALKLGWDIGADHVVTGRFSGTPEKFQIIARLVNMETGGAGQLVAEGKLEDVIPLTMSVTWQLLRKVVPGTVSPEADYTARPPTPRSAFENYVRGILNQDLRKRMELLQTAVRLHPQYGAALFQVGRAYHLERDFQNSNQWLERIPETSFLHRQAQFLIGLNYFYLGDSPLAIAAFQALPQTYDVLLNLGAAFSEKDDTVSALATWKRAADMDQLGSDAFFNMGYVSFLKGDLDGAAKNLDESLKLRGRDSEALFLLGRTYEKQGRLEESQKAIAQASRLSQRVERWVNQPLPKLERLAAATVFRSHNEIWTLPRFARRARSQDLGAWLESIQTDVDSYLFGDALRELQDVFRIYPESAEARSLLEEVHRQRNLK
ncbi:MAG TPA: tetratricopeptide repeat protein [Terriglobia bacterium]|nr:tetratricopeptide repeat protein [Terriglobia bacterium]